MCSFLLDQKDNFPGVGAAPLLYDMHISKTHILFYQFHSGQVLDNFPQPNFCKNDILNVRLLSAFLFLCMKGITYHVKFHSQKIVCVCVCVSTQDGFQRITRGAGGII